MCGIFGYVGEKQAEPILLKGLLDLEYRGYDSAGIYVPEYGVVKAVGPIINLAKKLKGDITGQSGIAHTRWATHGEPTELNAHPHTDQSETIWLAHNGIIENFKDLREMLEAQDIEFKTSTDTEVLVKLIGSLYAGDLKQAVVAALKMVRGTYGIVVMSADNPDEIITVRFGSPIVLGIGSDGNFISSDPSALLEHTKEIVYLDDGEVAVVTKDSYEVTSLDGDKKNKKPETFEWDIEQVQKGGYEHFMLKEIMEAPEVIKNTIRGRLIASKGKVKLGGIEAILNQITNLNRLTIVGCGSAYYAGLVGKYMLEEYAGLPVDVELGSEYRYKKNLPDKNSAVLAITQSGETADTLASVREAKELGLLTLGIVNAVGSTIARETDAGVYNHAGPEIAVASTKAFLSQLTVLVLLTILIGKERGLDEAERIKIAKDLEKLPSIIEKMLSDTSEIESIAKKYAARRDFMYIGRKFHTPIAYEGSLKLKEVAYIHAEAYAGGELKHGPIAMLDEEFPLLAIAPNDDVYEKMVSNIEEVRARKAPAIVLTTDDIDVDGEYEDVIYMPKVHPILQPIVSTVPLQLLAYYVGIGKGLNVDRPRNLAKSVTVE